MAAGIYHPTKPRNRIKQPYSPETSNNPETWCQANILGFASVVIRVAQLFDALEEPLPDFQMMRYMVSHNSATLNLHNSNNV